MMGLKTGRTGCGGGHLGLLSEPDRAQPAADRRQAAGHACPRAGGGARATVRGCGCDALRCAADRGAGHARSPSVPRPRQTGSTSWRGAFPAGRPLIAAQQRRVAALEALVEGLRDRLGHDPVLAESMHEVLSTVAAIRSTADILVRETDLDPVWRGRFHRNLHEEAERLSTRATALLGHFEAEEAEAARAPGLDPDRDGRGDVRGCGPPFPDDRGRGRGGDPGRAGGCGGDGRSLRPARWARAGCGPMRGGCRAPAAGR